MVQVLGYPWLSKACTELSVLVSACLQLLGASLLLSTLQVGYKCEGLWFHFGVGEGVSCSAVPEECIEYASRCVAVVQASSTCMLEYKAKTFLCIFATMFLICAL